MGACDVLSFEIKHYVLDTRCKLPMISQCPLSFFHFAGRSYDFEARPSKAMTPLKPEDHHMIQKAIQAGNWAQVGTIYEVMDEKSGALTVPSHQEPCNIVGDF